MLWPVGVTATKVFFGVAVVVVDRCGQFLLTCPNSWHEKHLVRASSSDSVPLM